MWEKKIKELSERIEALEKERRGLLEHRNGVDAQLNEIVAEILRCHGGIRAVRELHEPPAPAPAPARKS